MQTKLKENQVALSELQSKQMPTEFELARVSHEKQLVDGKLEHVEQELANKTKAERELRQTFAAELHEVQTRLQVSNIESESRLKQIAALKVRS